MTKNRFLKAINKNDNLKIAPEVQMLFAVAVWFVLLVWMSFVFSALPALARMANDPLADSVVVVDAKMIGILVHFLRCRFPTSWSDELPSIHFNKFCVASLPGFALRLGCSALL